MNRRRSRAAWLGVLLALAVAAWLFVDLVAPVVRAPESSEHTENAHSALLITGADAAEDIADDSVIRAPILKGARDRTGPVTVHVVTSSGHPLPDLMLWAASDAGDVHAAGSTDAKGRFEFADLPYDGSVQVVVATGEKGRPLGKVKVTRRNATITVGALPLRVLAQASDGGQMLRGVSYTYDPHLKEKYGVTGDVREHFVLLAPGAKGKLALKPRAPSGYFAWDKTEQGVQISPQARSLLYVVPLRPEADVHATLPEGRRNWAFTATLQGVAIPGIESISDAFGRTRLRGIPFVPGASVRAKATSDGHVARAAGYIGHDERDIVELAFHLPKTMDKQEAAVQAGMLHVERAQIQLAALTSYTAGYRLRVSGTENAFVLQVLLSQTPALPKTKPRRVELRIQDPDGKPAAGARVGLAGRPPQTADARGRVVFTGLNPGEHLVSVSGAGPSWRESITIADARRQTHHVFVPWPGTIDLQVLGPSGYPLPHARLAVKQASKLPWYDIEDGEQRLDPFTDHNGQRRLRNLQPDTDITITASLAGESRKVVVRVESGQVKPVRIDMSAPPEPKKKPKPVDRPKIIDQWGNTIQILRGKIETTVKTRKTKKTK